MIRLTELQLPVCLLQHEACRPSAEFFNGMEELKCSSADQLRHKLPSLRSQLQQDTTFRDVYNFAYMWRWVALNHGDGGCSSQCAEHFCLLSATGQQHAMLPGTRKVTVTCTAELTVACLWGTMDARSVCQLSRTGAHLLPAACC